MPYPKKRKRTEQDDKSPKTYKRNRSQPAKDSAMLRSAMQPVKSGLQASTQTLKTYAKTQGPRVAKKAINAGSSKGGGKFRELNNRGKPSRSANGAFGKQKLNNKFSRISKDIHTEEYICSTYAIPRAADYGLDTEPLDDPSTLLLAANLDSVTQSFKESPIHTRYTERVELKLELGDESMLLLSTGHGRTREEAERNAHLHAIVQLHAKGFLKEILPGGHFFLAKQTGVQTADAAAKKDVIDYAARHDCLPTFTSSMGRSKLKRKLVTAKVAIEDMALVGLGRQSTVDGAFLQACLSLKAAAEARHEKDGDGMLLIKDYTKLTSASARQFVEYYCHNQRLYHNVSTQSKNLPRMASQWATTIVVQKLRSSGDAETDPTEASYEGIPMKLKKDAEDTGYLAAALALKKENSSLWTSFVKEIRRGNGEVLRAVRPIDVPLDNTTTEMLRRTQDEVSSLVSSQAEATVNEKARSADKIRNNRQSRLLSDDMVIERNLQLKQKLEQYETNHSTEEIRRKRSELPMVQHKAELLEMIHQNDVCVVVGATGSGKTTQLPQLLLEELTRRGDGAACNIICTQPRRIAAISVAQRVAVERNEALQESIGYAVRFDSKLPRFGGSIAYCTTGILLRQLQDGQDSVLEGLSHIIVDEVHERDVQIDFLLVLLRRTLAQRRSDGKSTFKIILMSATIDTNLFCKYFGEGFKDKRCPSISIPGRTFPVTTHHLDEIHKLLASTYDRRAASELYTKDTASYVSKELSRDLALTAPPTENNSEADEDERAVINWSAKGLVGADGELELAQEKEDTITPVELIATTIAHLLKTTEDGSILVFLPGLQEITALNRILTSTKPLGLDLVNDSMYKLYMLHSAIPQMQQEVFEKLAEGQRKIILSTNIAETSITIPDVIYVVDSAKVRESQYDAAKRISSLVSTWTSKSSAKQRAGRAGRVQNGHYYTMASEARYDSLEITALPEILRTDLQELCLQIKSMGIVDIRDFLSQAVQPPVASSVDSAIEHLQALRALDEHENLTPLGKMLSTLPVQPSLGKMVILAAIFRCLDPIIILAAAATGKDPFLNPPDRRNEAERVRVKWSEGSGSDHIALLNAFKAWRALRGRGNEDRAFAFDNFLHYNSLISIAQTGDQILELMQKAGIAKSEGSKRQRFRMSYGSAEENENANSKALLSALLTAGFFPNVAIQTPAGRALRTAHENAAQIHINSLAAPKSAGSSRYGPVDRDTLAPPGTLYTFAQKTQADQSTIMLRTISKTSPLSVILFGGLTTIEGPILKVDDWIPFYLRTQQMQVVTTLAKQLDHYLESTFSRLGAINQRKLLNQGDGGTAFLDRDPIREPLVTAIVKALEQSDSPHSSQRSYDRRPTSFRSSRGPTRVADPNITRRFEALFSPSSASRDERALAR